MTIIVPQSCRWCQRRHRAGELLQKLSEQLGKLSSWTTAPADGNVGAVAAAKAKPDGYT